MPSNISKQMIRKHIYSNVILCCFKFSPIRRYHFINMSANVMNPEGGRNKEGNKLSQGSRPNASIRIPKLHALLTTN